MKVLLPFLGSALLLTATAAHAASKPMLQGSDTMAGVMTDAILASGMNEQIGYVGGGSGLGETALMNGEQAVAPMSREAKPEAIAAISKRGLSLVPHVVGLDGVGIFMNAANAGVTLDLPTIKSIFTCAVTKWEQIPGAKTTGAITVYRRDDKSGTTDTIKNLVGIKAFGACAQVVAETSDIAEKTATDAAAVGYAGLSAKRPTNEAVAVAAKAGDQAILPTAATVRASTYPLSRKLFVYEVKGGVSAVEAQLLERLLDRSFLDPIIQDNEFFTID